MAKTSGWVKTSVVVGGLGLLLTAGVILASSVGNARDRNTAQDREIVEIIGDLKRHEDQLTEIREFCKEQQKLNRKLDRVLGWIDHFMGMAPDAGDNP
jgi:hypothetical protein